MPFVILLLTTTAAPVAAIAAPTPRAMDPHPHLEDEEEVVVAVVVVSAEFSFSTVLLDTDDQRDDGLNPPGTELEELAPARSLIPSWFCLSSASEDDPAFHAAAAGKYADTNE